ncbi:MAG: hypothetical protein K8I60_17025, partial [Anaerolineae bacterium]|nr:hypothetical protein [Anaerolineae bacterium]
LTSTPPPTVPPQPSPLAVCAAFGLDTQGNSLTFPIGTSPQIYWLPVEGAVSYRISLINDLGEELMADYTAETTFAFQSDLFARDKRYGWQVYPMDLLRQQMCIAVGAELIPQ